MRCFSFGSIAAIVGLLGSQAAVAEECLRPNFRTTNALVTAISQDEEMAHGFETAAAACGTDTRACDEAKVRCGQLLTSTLQRQLSFDEGAYLRDMLMGYAGQPYPMSVSIASAPAIADVSCNADAASLKAAATRRRQQAERRKVMTAEYPRWIAWVNDQYKRCNDRLAVEKTQAAAQAAEAAKQAQLLKEKNLVPKPPDGTDAAEQARREKAAEDKRAAEKQAETERRAKESAAQRAAREAQEAANAKIVAEREGRKAAGEKKRQVVIDQEKVRADEVKARAEASRKGAEEAHRKKVEELTRSIELSEADKAARLAEVDKEYQAAEALRREEAGKALEQVEVIDRSDERLRGALSVHLSGGYLSIGDEAKVMLGAQITIRQGFWGTAPARGLAAGVELRASALVLIATDGKTYFVQVSPEIRYWFGFLGLGAAFDYQRIQRLDVAADTLGVGPTLSLAALDNPDSRLLFTLRWTPFLNQQYERITGEIEGGYQLFSFGLQGGVIKQGKSAALPAPPLGFFVGGFLGVRLRW